MYFAENIKYLRKKNKLSQEDLAKKLGYKNYTTITKWESKLSEPPLSMVSVVADLFGVSMNEIVNVNLSLEEQFFHEPEAIRMADEIMNREGMKILFEATRDLDIEDVELVVQIINRLKK